MRDCCTRRLLRACPKGGGRMRCHIVREAASGWAKIGRWTYTLSVADGPRDAALFDLTPYALVYARETVVCSQSSRGWSTVMRAAGWTAGAVRLTAGGTDFATNLYVPFGAAAAAGMRDGVSVFYRVLVGDDSSNAVTVTQEFWGLKL